MKKTYFLFLFLLTSFSFGQSYTVLNAAVGEFLAFQPIFDDSELFGYIELRTMNIDEKNNVTIKYIALDKNFNTMCSGTFIEKTSNSRRKKKFNDITYSDGLVRIDFFEYYKALDIEVPFFKTYQVIDLKKNIVTSSGIYNPEIKEIDKQYAKIDTKGYFCYSLNKGGFLIHETNPDTKIGNEASFYYALNSKNEKIWEYKASRELKKYLMSYNTLNYDEKYIVLEGFFYKKSKREQLHIQVLDSKTGKEVLYFPTSSEYTLSREYTYLIDDKIYTGGRFFEKNSKEEYVTDESLGIYQTIIDIKNNKVIRDKYVKYEQFPDLKINKHGKVRGEGYLSFKKTSINPDGTTFVLGEAYWQKQQYRAYTQLYTFLMDKDFNPVKTVEYEVKRTKGSKYDFAQRLANQSGRAYFFFDKNDDRDLELNILNYYFKSKKQVIQKMPITNDDSVINVFPAKSGYVGIAEYFKKPEKAGKFMEIRLEKLNYERE
ncbi:DUF6770 family protein [Flavobacterium sp. DGU38]|uniref:DUF6770 family protein n=1 Tax=Flavobacterium calami TaxID=3139144 RepID=A0ABU9IL48_9FLAO